MSFKAHGVLISGIQERAELAHPVDDAASHALPLVFAVPCFNCVFHMAMPDAVFGDELISIGIRNLAVRSRVAGVPVQHEMRALFPASRSRPSSHTCWRPR